MCMTDRDGSGLDRFMSMALTPSAVLSMCTPLERTAKSLFATRGRQADRRPADRLTCAGDLLRRVRLAIANQSSHQPASSRKISSPRT